MKNPVAIATKRLFIKLHAYLDNLPDRSENFGVGDVIPHFY